MKSLIESINEAIAAKDKIGYTVQTSELGDLEMRGVMRDEPKRAMAAAEKAYKKDIEGILKSMGRPKKTTDWVNAPSWGWTKTIEYDMRDYKKDVNEAPIIQELIKRGAPAEITSMFQTYLWPDYDLKKDKFEIEFSVGKYDDLKVKIKAVNDDVAKELVLWKDAKRTVQIGR